MPKRRANGEGNIRKRKDGRWEGRYTVGHDPETGKAIIKNVLGKTQAEVKEKLKKAIEKNARPHHRTSAGRTAGAKVDGCRLPAWRAENPTGHLAAERQGSGSPAENEKRLPHTAVVGRRDKRTENAEMQSRK